MVIVNESRQKILVHIFQNVSNKRACRRIGYMLVMSCLKDKLVLKTNHHSMSDMVDITSAYFTSQDRILVPNKGWVDLEAQIKNF